MAEIIKTNRNNEKLTYNGFIYHFHVKRRSKTFWACIYRAKCRGRIFSVNVDGQLEIQIIAEHTHDPEPAKVVFLKTKCNLKQMAIESISDPSEVVRQELASLTPTERAFLPTVEHLCKLVRTFRSSIQPTVADLVVPTAHCKTTSGRQFLLHDNIIRNEIDKTIQRTMIFATEENLRLLFASEVWYADSTFGIKPTLFHQLWTIQGKVKNYSFPLVYVLMQSNEEEEYVQVLRLLLQKAAQYHEHGKPSTILIDFSKGCLNALKSVFPHAHLSISFHHFTQSVYSKMQVTMKSVEYTALARDWLRAAVGLAFLRPTDVKPTFQLLMQRLENEPTENFVGMDEVAQYLDTNYVRGEMQALGTWIPPRYPIEMWNMYKRAIESDLMSDSLAEEWYHKFTRHVRRHKASFDALIQNIRMEQKLTESVLRKTMAGIMLPKKNTILNHERFMECLQQNPVFSSPDKILEYCTTLGSFSTLPMP